MIIGGVYLSEAYGIVRLRKVYPAGVSIVDELNEDFSYKTIDPRKLKGVANWVTRALPKEHTHALVEVDVSEENEKPVEQMEFL